MKFIDCIILQITSLAEGLTAMSSLPLDKSVLFCLGHLDIPTQLTDTVESIIPFCV
jgi:hypothetical protein